MKTHYWVAVGVTIALVAGCASQSRVSKTSAPVTNSSPSDDFQVVSAVYGSDIYFADVTRRVDELLHNRDDTLLARTDWLRTDPAPGCNKTLVIVYEFKGRRHISITGEGGGVSLEQLKLAK